MTEAERAALVERIAATLERYADTAHVIPNATHDTAVAILTGIEAAIEPAIRADERGRVVEEVTRRLEICAYDHWVLSETDSLELADRVGHRMCAVAVDTEVSAIRAALTPDPPSNP